MHTQVSKTRNDLKALPQPVEGWTTIEEKAFFYGVSYWFVGYLRQIQEVDRAAVWHHGNYDPTPEFSSKQVEAGAATQKNRDDLLQK